MNKKIAILGCGWLGTPLATALLENGHNVKGSTTSIEKIEPLRRLGIDTHLIRLEEQDIYGDISGFLNDVNILVVNIPPQLRRKPYHNFVKRIALLKGVLENSAIEKVIFVSSTSVYGNVTGEVTEATVPKPATESGKQLLEAEKLLMDSTKLSATIIRFGGLIGPKRHPITFLSGKEGLKGGEERINLIHLNDCIALITTIIKEELWNGLYNGVYPYHPTKKEYYTQEARKRDLPIPRYSSESDKNYKKIIKSKLKLTNNDIFLTSITL